MCMYMNKGEITKCKWRLTIVYLYPIFTFQSYLYLFLVQLGK